MPAWEDLTEFFDPDEFADRGELERNDQMIGEIFGMFTDPSEQKELADFEHTDLDPVFLYPLNNAPEIRRHDVLTIKGKTYDVLEPPEQDGTGRAGVKLGKPTVKYNAGI
jgi:hypothetical protein